MEVEGVWDNSCVKVVNVYGPNNSDGKKEVWQALLGRLDESIMNYWCVLAILTPCEMTRKGEGVVLRDIAVKRTLSINSCWTPDSSIYH